MNSKNFIHSTNLTNLLSSLFFYLSITFFLIAFNFSDNPLPSGWYQQFMPNLGGRPISDIFFLDSLTGWAVTPYVNINDTAYVLKTTNGGDNWFFSNITVGQFVGNKRVYFLNAATGFACGTSQTGLTKSTDGGFSWSALNVPVPNMLYDDMSILNIDTIWLAASSNPTGGVFRTTNGGASWIQQLNLGSQNPDHIYMFNGRIGFIAKDGDYLRRTTNSGVNWSLISGVEGFIDMYFADSLTGWKSYGSMKKTTNGGLNWTTQVLPTGGDIQISAMYEFANVNNDTIWGVGGEILQGSLKGMIYKTTNGGDNWLFQVPNISPNIPQYIYNDFVNKNNGWAYPNVNRGVHTVTGGDTISYASVQQISNEVPKWFSLHQNHPNPFNSMTKFKFQIPKVKSKTSNLKINVYDITGKLTVVLVDSYLKPGEYEIDFVGTDYSSGIYFYSLIVDGKLIDTKKMILVK